MDNVFNPAEDTTDLGEFYLPVVFDEFSLVEYCHHFSYTSGKHVQQVTKPLLAQSVRVRQYSKKSGSQGDLTEVFALWGQELEHIAVPENRIGHIFFSDDPRYADIQKLFINGTLVYMPVVFQNQVAWYGFRFESEKEKEFSIYTVIRKPHSLSGRILFLALV